MLRDLHLTARGLLKRPAFSAVVILTLGLGLGANATLLAVADAVLLRPLPYPEPDRLVSLYETVRRDGVEERRTFSYPDFAAVRERASALSSLAAIANESAVWENDGGIERLRSAWVSPAYFDVLASPPQIGRVFAAENLSEDPGAVGDDIAQEVVLSHWIWQLHFAADAEVLGQVLRIDGDDFTVIGVMPEGYGDDSGYDLWLPILLFGPDTLNQRADRSFGVIGRLAPDASIELAQGQVDTIFTHLEEEWPDSNLGRGGMVISMHRDSVGSLKEPVMLLGGAVGLLLLLACFNVANMLLVESLRRRRPAAIRLALGARPWHLFRATLFETLLLAVAGAGLGLMIAAWGLPVLDRLSPVRLPSWAAVDLNIRVALMTFLGVGLIGTVLAAVTAWLDAGPTLAIARHGTRSVAGAATGNRLRSLLLGAQIALAFVVAAGALLLTLSFKEWSQIDPGFSERELVFMQASLPRADADSRTERQLSYLAQGQEILDQALSLPGVQSAALASDLPLEGGYSANVVAAEGAVPKPEEPYEGGYRTYRHFVSADYFKTLGLPIVRGRSFNAKEPLDGPGVAVVSTELAARLWPGEADPIGKRLRIGAPSAEPDPDAIWLEVIGVTGEVRHRTLRPDPERISEDPDLYLSLDQFPRREIACAVLVSSQAGERLAALRQIMEPIRSKIPIFGWRTFQDHLGAELRTTRFSTLMMSIFAGLALILAAVGVYGVFSHRVNERRREIGVRMALGADRSRVLGWVLRDATLVIGLGVLTGWLAAWALSNALQNILGDLLYGVGAKDPRIFTAVALMVVAAGLSACLLPARQATRVDPQVVLRQE